ncbi:MAG TPA: hypothetical protein VMA09_12680 [Candidatus Binataceae bacterium]|nr:hypothetical protein [Candidatus Binataceae bacterium]
MSLNSPGGEAARDRETTQAQVRQDVVRFASSYFASLTQAFDSVERAARTPDERVMVADPKVKYCNALIDIALGPKPEANLLDMVVLATLLHDVMKDYWVPKVYGASGQPLLAATERGKQDIWAIADTILTTAQQRSLADLIARWRADHPDQIYVAEVRLQSFTKEFGTNAVAGLERSTLLPEVADATRSIDEFRLLSERLLLYLQEAPALFRMEAQLGEYQIAAQQETKDLLNSVTTFSQAADRVANSVETMPENLGEQRRVAIEQLMTAVANERRQALDQVFDRFKTEEAALFASLKASQRPSQELLGATQATLATALQLVSQVNHSLDAFDRLALKMGWETPNSPPFQINDYQKAAEQLGQTARDLTTLTRESRATLRSSIWLATLALAGLILFAAAIALTAVLIYRRLTHPISSIT